MYQFIHLVVYKYIFLILPILVTLLIFANWVNEKVSHFPDYERCWVLPLCLLSIHISFKNWHFNFFNYWYLDLWLLRALAPTWDSHIFTCKMRAVDQSLPFLKLYEFMNGCYEYVRLCHLSLCCSYLCVEIVKNITEHRNHRIL